jgi:hypothetical protein
VEALQCLASAARVIWAKPARDDRWWLMRPYVTSRKAVDWLARKGGIASSEARAWLTELDLDPDRRIGELAGNPRTLLGLAASWAGGAEVVVFTTAGCDPGGKRRIAGEVERRLNQCPAIHLTYPVTCQGRTEPGCLPLPGRICREVTRRSLVATR